MGTEEGGYLFSSDEGRRSWRRAGPFLAGESVNSVRYSPDDGRLYAATLTEGVFASESLGRRWVPLNRGLATAPGECRGMRMMICCNGIVCP